MKKLLEKQTKEELLEFILEYANNNERFANAVDVRFGEPEYKKEINKFKKQICHALGNISDYHHHGGWGYIDVDVSDIITEARFRAKQGHVKLAFIEMEMIYCELLKNFEYQAECEIADEAESCLEIMLEIAEKAVDSDDKEYIFNQCIALTDYDEGDCKDYGADYEDKLLRIAAKLVTTGNRTELERVISVYDSEWRKDEFKLIHYDIINKLDGTDATEKFIADNLQFESIREIAYDNAVYRKEHGIAEKLCIDALKVHKQHGFSVSPWLNKLYLVYENTEDKSKLAQTAQKIVLAGDLKYYEKLKSLLTEQNTWNESYPELLQECKLKLPYIKYMEILAKENECELLLGEAKKHPEQIYNHGKMLAKKHKSETLIIFSEQIEKEAKSAYGREAYNKVCANISTFAKAGYENEAIKIVDEFKILYKRKPAFVDELGKIGIN